MQVVFSLSIMLHRCC